VRKRGTLFEVARRTLAYGIGDAFARGTNLILLPVYAALLSPEEYGTLSIALVLGAMLNMLLAFGMNGAALKFYYGFEGPERKSFYGAIWVFLLAVPACLLLLVELSGGFPLRQMLLHVPYSPHIRLTLWTAYATVAFVTIPREVFRASGRSGAYLLLNAAGFLSIVGLTALLVAKLRLGAEGALQARLYASIVLALIAVSIVWRVASLRGMRVRFVRTALGYGVPLIPHYLAHWSLGLVDRVILERFVPLAQVGIYSAGYQIGAAMLLASGAINNALIPLFGRANRSDEGALRMLARVITYYVLAVSTLALVLSTFAREFVMILTPDAYQQAVQVVPLVVLGYLFLALYYPSMNVLTLMAGKTRFVGAMTGFAAGGNVALNLWLIPRIGIQGAAVSTAIAFACLFLLVSVASNCTLRLPLEYKRIGLVLFAVLASYVAGFLVAQRAPAHSLWIRSASLCLYPVILLVGGFLTDVEKRFLARVLGGRCARRTK